LNKSEWNNTLSDKGNIINRRPATERHDSSLLLKELETFFQQNDPRNSFCGLNRFCDNGVNDVVWTRNEGSAFQKVSVRAQLDKEFQHNSVDSNTFNSQPGLLHRDITLQKPNLAQCAPNTVQVTSRNRVRSNNYARKIPSSLSDFTPTTKQTQGSISTVTYHSTTVSNSDRHNVISSEPIIMGNRQNEYPYSSVVTSQANSHPIVADATLGNHNPGTSNLLLYNHSTHISIGGREKHETHSSVTSVEDLGYFGRQASMLSSVTLKKYHHTPSDISSLVSNSTLEKYQGMPTYKVNSVRSNQPTQAYTVVARKTQNSLEEASSNERSKWMNESNSADD